MLFHQNFLRIQKVLKESAVNIMEQILFGKYTVTGLLTAGANSHVYLARHLLLEQDRVIKRIAKSSPARSCFHSEATLLKSLKHPAIPVIYDIEEDESFFYIIEEYVRGESLEACVLHQKTISLSFLLQTGRQLCDVIAYLHGLPTPVIYQDLKPEHIIVYGDQIKIVDFGIASFGTDAKNPYSFYGTADYAAPEKYTSGICDERTDIYGIGMVLHFLEQHLAPSERAAQISRIIGQAIEPEPAKRISDVSELAMRLQQEGEQRDLQEEKHLYRHWNRNLAVIGMRRGTGATHIALACSVCLNASGMPSLYVQEDHSGDLSRMMGTAAGARTEQGIFRMGDLCATASRRCAQDWAAQQEGWLVSDLGAYESTDIELEACDGILLVLGGRAWELEQAERLYERLRLHRALIPVVNYGNEQAARVYAKHWRRRVYCFPLDGEPTVLTREKRQFFDGLRKKERW